jgi:hypothetical protein
MSGNAMQVVNIHRGTTQLQYRRARAQGMPAALARSERG